MAILPWRRKEHRRTIGLPAAQSNIDGGLDLDVRFFGANLTLTPRDTRIIPQTGGAAAPDTAIQDVKIAYVVDCSFGDCDEEEQCVWNEIGNHLRTNPLFGFCDLDFTTWLPVLPNCGHSIAEFNQVAWNINDGNQPTFNVFREANVPSPDCSVPVWRMTFGEGEKWTTPPTNLCGTPGGSTGACCESDGACTDGRTQSECESGGGNFIGEGTTCGLLAGSCNDDPPGACCCPVGSACYNDAIGGPVTCSANVAEAQCATDGGTWQGAFTTCAGSPCGGAISGACCMPNNQCQQQPDDVACGLAGGVFFAGEICPGGTETFGACCFGLNCLMSNRLCCESQSGSWVGGLCSADPCGGGAQQPTGQQAGRSA